MIRVRGVAVIVALLAPWAFAQSPAVKVPIDDQVAMNALRQADGAATGDAESKGYWVDGDKKLMWAIKDNGSDIDWDHADAYCRALTLGALTGWHLASIDELHGMFDESKTGDYKIRGPIQLSGNWAWSGTKDGERQAWYEDFFFGERNSVFRDFTKHLRALCVRAR